MECDKKKSSDIPLPILADLMEVYTFLRTMSLSLKLSPFDIETFIVHLLPPDLNQEESLKCLDTSNDLLAEVHLALIAASISEIDLEISSSWMYFDWSLLDIATWPVFLDQFFSDYLKKVRGWGDQTTADLDLIKETLADMNECRRSNALRYQFFPISTKVKILSSFISIILTKEAVQSEMEVLYIYSKFLELRS